MLLESHGFILRVKLIFVVFEGETENRRGRNIVISCEGRGFVEFFRAIQKRLGPRVMPGMTILVSVFTVAIFTAMAELGCAEGSLTCWPLVGDGDRPISFENDGPNVSRRPPFFLTMIWELVPRLG